MSFATLAIWIKIFFNCNMLDMLAPYVRAIQSIFPKISAFLILFIILTLGFGDALKVISLANENPSKDSNIGNGFL
jgi:hypothetical protein